MSTPRSPELCKLDRRNRDGRWLLRWLTSGSVALMLAGLPMAVQAEFDVPAERARIAAERADAERRYAVARADCAQRFIVTGCVTNVTRQHRDTLDALRRQTLALNEGERRRVAAARLRNLDDKAAGASAASSASGGRPAALPLPVVRPRLPVPNSPETAVTPLLPPAAPFAPGAVRVHRAAAAVEQRQRAAEAAERVQKRTQRLDEAAAHRLAVERREQARHLVAPLPIPDSASTPQRP